MRRIGVFTSGGDAPGMNACIRAVVRSAINYGTEVVGIRRGYQGMIEGDFIEMDSHSVSNIIQRGGTILYSSRSETFRTKEGRQRAYEQLKGAGIEGLVGIGGNGTFTGADIFYKEFGIPAVGVPGTIDNDLYGTDFTIGYDTALNTVVEAIDKIRDTADSHDRVFFIEVMGRDAGFIALYSGIAGGVESILIPEMEYDMLNLVKTLNKGWQHKKNSLIVLVAEGDEEGGAYEVANRVKEKFAEMEARIVVLGHIQRGGAPSCNDRVLATLLGVSAVEALLKGIQGVMVGQIHHDIVFTPFEEAITKHNTINKRLFRVMEVLSNY